MSIEIERVPNIKSKLTSEKLEEIVKILNDYKDKHEPTCIKRHVVAMLYDIETNDILSFGTNGPSKKCDCIRTSFESGTNLHLCAGAHAEITAIINIAKDPNVELTENTVMVVTHKPCLQCAAAIIESGVKMVLYLEDYPSDFTDGFLYRNDVTLLQIKDDDENK